MVRRTVRAAVGITNSTKAKLIVAVNATLALAIGFGLPVDDAQTALILAAVNAFLGLLVHSPKTPSGTSRP